MDFVVGLPLTPGKNNAIWVIMDRLTKIVHFIAMRNTLTLNAYLEGIVRLTLNACLEGIVRLHAIPTTIVFDRNTRFLSCFWQRLQEAFGTLFLIQLFTQLWMHN